MKIVLIQPPFSDFYQTKIRKFPLGLLSIASYIKSKSSDYEIVIYDTLVSDKKKSEKVPKELEYTKQFFVEDISPFHIFQNYYRFGDNLDDILERVKNEKPDIVGISLLFLAYEKEALEVAKGIKSILPNTIIVLGGGGVTSKPEYFENRDYIDHLILGEGEEQFFNFIESIKENKNISNISNKTKNSEYLDIKELPITDYSFLNPENYKYGKDKMAMLLTSRSCPLKCSYCSVHQVFGTKFRQRDVDSIVEEISKAVEFGITHFDFEDDNLLVSKKFAIELFSKIDKIFSGKSLSFSAMNGLSFDRIDHETLLLMKKIGFSTLNLAVVTVDSKIQKDWKRYFNYDKYSSVVEMASDLGFSVVTYQIIGAPSQKLSDMIKTTQFIAQNRTLIGTSIFYAIPQTPIFSEIDSKNFKPIHARSTAIFYENSEFTKEDIATLFYGTRVLNFIKSLIQIDNSHPSLDINSIKNHINKTKESWEKDIFENYKYIKEIILTKNIGNFKLDMNSIGIAILEEIIDKRVILGVFRTPKKGEYIFKPLNLNNKVLWRLLNLL
ncbi:B12-binding domain-containing radical SAM protein [bacterium]|nr:B12-binding domain-containing radical SAM protein [bacterium]